ncbi:MAG: hypothetical protein HQK62_10965 [Desulfamplus sp.]|nr:hypothetical protein [Desulfamplus sp.]
MVNIQTVMLKEIISGEIRQKTNIKRVSLDEIDLSDETFKISSDNISCHNTSSNNNLNSVNTSFSHDAILADNPLSSLASSINSIGLINLPVLIKINSNFHHKGQSSSCNKAQNRSTFQIICGFRRVQAMKSICMADTLAMVLEYDKSHAVLEHDESRIEPDDKYLRSINSNVWSKDKHIASNDSDNRVRRTDNHVDSMDVETYACCAILAITDNAFQRPLTVMEQARSVLLLKRFLCVEDIASASYAIFNSSMNQSVVNMLGDLAQMDESVHELIEQERIAMGPALKLKSFNTDEINAFVTLFSKIRTGLNKQKEIITHIIEIAAREDISICDVIKSDDIREIIGDDIDDNKNDNTNWQDAVQDYKAVDDTSKSADEKRKKSINENSKKGIDENRKGNLVRALLFQRRYPNLAKAKDNFAINLRNLKLKNDVRLDPPVDFEGRDYTFTFKVSSVEEMAKKVELLSEIGKNPLLAQILS